MSLLRLGGRVVALLGPARGLAITLALANAALAGVGFLGPLACWRRRTGKGTRLYSSWHVARFRAALMLTGCGCPLDDVVALTRARPGARPRAASRSARR